MPPRFRQVRPDARQLDMDVNEPPRRPASARLGGSSAHPGIGGLLRQAHRTYNQALQQQIAPMNISLAQYLHLRVLWEREGLTQVEISHEVGIEKASSTAVFDSLEANGLIQRTRSASDRRKVEVVLTRAGKELQHLARPQGLGVATAAVAGLDKAEVDAFVKVLRKIIINLDPAAPAPAKPTRRTKE